jgi:hypothetical protein
MFGNPPYREPAYRVCSGQPKRETALMLGQLLVNALTGEMKQYFKWMVIRLIRS